LPHMFFFPHFSFLDLALPFTETNMILSEGCSSVCSLVVWP
jgi:hypothetical protein